MTVFRIIGEGCATVAAGGKHISLRAIKLVSNTDMFDTLVDERTALAFAGSTPLLEGQIFIACDQLADTCDVIVVPAPDHVMPTARLADGVISVDACGYPVYHAACHPSEAERTVRAWYRERYTPTVLHAMSNTWGDRNGRSRVSDDFIRREIDSAADLGIDVVQIDDGWQRGIPNVFDSEKNRVFEGDFWELRDEVFPYGLATLSDYARERGLELGLWFAPHSRGAFEHFERDLSVLRSAYRDAGIRYFKLDMVNLPTAAHCERMTELLDSILGTGDGVTVELDVTADKRLGYLAAAPYGTIFVENRYTAWGNYYPHRTLRNLWMLSRFIPAAKLQMELVNPDLFAESYSPDDLYRHTTYTSDYMFASVMLSNPLFWMETQFLNDGPRAKLKGIISPWRAHRDELTHADVYPILEEPSGSSLTGFVAETDTAVHILIFREVTDRDTATLRLDVDIDDPAVIACGSPSSVHLDGGTLTATLSEKRSYLWLRADKVTE